MSNHAGVAYLARAYPRLIRKYGSRGRFALILRIVNPHGYGHHLLEDVADVTGSVFRTPGHGTTTPTDADSADRASPGDGN